MKRNNINYWTKSILHTWITDIATISLIDRGLIYCNLISCIITRIFLCYFVTEKDIGIIMKDLIS